jgi:hypothetical protein
MLLTYGLLGALGVFYCGVIALWGWAMAQGVQSRLPELVRRRPTLR